MEELGESSHLLIVFLSECMLNNHVKVKKNFTHDFLSHLWRNDVRHLVLKLVELHAAEIIKLYLTMDVELDFVL